MKKTKEIGYELGNVYWHNLEGFEQLWNKADTETKDKIVNGIGELAVKLVSEAATENEIALNLPVVMPRYLIANSTPTIKGKECLTVGNAYKILNEFDGWVCVIDDHNRMEVMVN